jgi:protein-disulfide isomerase
VSWPVGVIGSTVAGIGFTVSLLVASLAFRGQQLEEAKLGVLAAAAIATALGAVGVRLLARLPVAFIARQVAGTREDILDLAEDVDPEVDHVRGATDALVTVVEYGHYECEYCGRAEVTIRELLRSFDVDLRYVWRHLPLNDVHLHAQLAAEAVEAAGEQGAFWPLHDRLLDHQDELRPDDLGRHVAALGLDVERFWRVLETHGVNDRIERDVASADASGVAGTPSFFINGRRHEGAYDVATLSASVRAARQRAQLLRAAAAS